MTRARSLAGLAALSALLFAGCAAQVVRGEHLIQKTAFALGLEAKDFTIADRVDDGLQTRYSVRTSDGRRFNCYVEGSMSMIGSIVSDALCSPIGGSGKSAPSPAKGKAGSPPAAAACNDLLRAAGRC